MTSEDEASKKTQAAEVKARNISHKVRCTECESRYIEDSQAISPFSFQKLICAQIHTEKSDKEIFKRLKNEYGKTVLYAPKFGMQTAALWLSPIIVAEAAGGVWAYNKA